METIVLYKPLCLEAFDFIVQIFLNVHCIYILKRWKSYSHLSQLSMFINNKIGYIICILKVKHLTDNNRSPEDSIIAKTVYLHVIKLFLDY